MTRAPSAHFTNIGFPVVCLAYIAALLVSGCAQGAPMELERGVSWELAERRAGTISDLRYDVSLSIPEARSEAIHGRVVARFTSSPGDDPIVLDFAQPAESVLAVTLNGTEAPFEARDEHIVVTLEDSGEHVSSRPAAGHDLEVAVDFVAGDGSLNRSDDFLYTLFVPDRARVALPVFDQPDLKARLKLVLEIPADWKAVANGSVESHEVSGDRATYTFTETDPIATYVFAFAAGRFEVETAERNGRQLRMFHRETDREKVERNRDVIFDLHAAALEWLEDYTGIPYPFEKFDFTAIPAFQYGGMEHPGAIFYRARGLMLDESATQNQRLGRASLIAHETAHMWFGNLVTMEWFNDVWMKEVFANFMAAKIVNPSFPDLDHDLRFLLAHHPSAYAVDRTEGANPIRQVLDNLNEAGSLYGAIIYQKAPIVMKHLELLMGEEAFREGLGQYLAAHRYGNATWPDLIDVLDSRTEEDLGEWSRVWVNEAGRPTIGVELDASDGTISMLSLVQRDPENRGRLWNQRLELLLGYQDGAEHRIPVHLREARFDSAEAEGLRTPDYVLPNGAGVGYGYFELDPTSREYLLGNLTGLPAPRTRAIGWITLWDAMLEGAVAPDELIALAMRALGTEDDELNTQRILSYLTAAYWRFVSSPQRADRAAALEALLWDLMSRAARPTLKAAYFGAYRRVVLTEAGLQRLVRIWSGEDELEGLPLSENDYTAMAQALAVRGLANAEEILDGQLARIENPDRRAQFEFVRPALAVDPSVLDEFFESLKDPRNREKEPWVLGGLGFLHHPLRSERSARYIRPSLEMLEEIQRTGDIFFPLAWLNATLGGHSSPAAAAIVEEFLESNDDLPPRLRGKLVQAADPLFRAARIVGE